MNDISPITNTKLYGHETAFVSLLKSFSTGTLPHGILISGPKGIGKATFAYQFARCVLAGDDSLEMSSQHPVFRRIAAGSHADFLVIEPLFDSKKDEFAREISVEQARVIAEFLSLTPGESDWRVVIIDSIDNLNPNAANAILKILEEPPPQALLMLISHNPGQLLPTIRSRCQQLKLTPLPPKKFAQVCLHVLPHVPTDRFEALSELSAMSPGIVQQLENQGALAVYMQIIDILSDLPSLDSQKIHGFAEQVYSGQTQQNWKLFSFLMLALLQRASKCAAGAAMREIHEDEPALLEKLAAMHSAGVWAEKWQQAADQFSLAARLHLDYKQVIIAFIHSISQTEGLQLGHAA